MVKAEKKWDPKKERALLILLDDYQEARFLQSVLEENILKSEYPFQRVISEPEPEIGIVYALSMPNIVGVILPEKFKDQRFADFLRGGLLAGQIQSERPGLPVVILQEGAVEKINALNAHRLTEEKLAYFNALVKKSDLFSSSANETSRREILRLLNYFRASYGAEVHLIKYKIPKVLDDFFFEILSKVEINYQTADRLQNELNNLPYMAIVGPSGAGKTTTLRKWQSIRAGKLNEKARHEGLSSTRAYARQIRKLNQKHLGTLLYPKRKNAAGQTTWLSGPKIIPCTTRAIRPKEKDGDDKYFITKEEFGELEKNDFFLLTMMHEGAKYGWAAEEIKRAGAEHEFYASVGLNFPIEVPGRFFVPLRLHGINRYGFHGLIKKIFIGCVYPQPTMALQNKLDKLRKRILTRDPAVVSEVDVERKYQLLQLLAVPHLYNGDLFNQDVIDFLVSDNVQTLELERKIQHSLNNLPD